MAPFWDKLNHQRCLYIYHFFLIFLIETVVCRVGGTQGFQWDEGDMLRSRSGKQLLRLNGWQHVQISCGPRGDPFIFRVYIDSNFSSRAWSRRFEIFWYVLLHISQEDWFRNGIVGDELGVALGPAVNACEGPGQRPVVTLICPANYELVSLSFCINNSCYVELLTTRSPIVQFFITTLLVARLQDVLEPFLYGR